MVQNGNVSKRMNQQHTFANFTHLFGGGAMFAKFKFMNKRTHQKIQKNQVLGH